MLQAKKLTNRVPMPVAVAFGLLSAALLAVVQPMGKLIFNFGVSYEVAAIIISLVTGGATTALFFLYPYIIPVVITLRTVLAVFGTAYAISW